MTTFYHFITFFEKFCPRAQYLCHNSTARHFMGKEAADGGALDHHVTEIAKPNMAVTRTISPCYRCKDFDTGQVHFSMKERKIEKVYGEREKASERWRDSEREREREREDY
jgi:hypothetical protein